MGQGIRSPATKVERHTKLPKPGLSCTTPTPHDEEEVLALSSLNGGDDLWTETGKHTQWEKTSDTTLLHRKGSAVAYNPQQAHSKSGSATPDLHSRTPLGWLAWGSGRSGRGARCPPLLFRLPFLALGYVRAGPIYYLRPSIPLRFLLHLPYKLPLGARLSATCCGHQGIQWHQTQPTPAFTVLTVKRARENIRRPADKQIADTSWREPI